MMALRVYTKAGTDIDGSGCKVQDDESSFSLCFAQQRQRDQAQMFNQVEGSCRGDMGQQCLRE
jgi:hypothetical protein